MTTDTALDWYNRLTGNSLSKSEIQLDRYHEEAGIVAAIQDAGTMTERAGGELLSRQAVACLIAAKQTY